jgi:hypothetical protein
MEPRENQFNILQKGRMLLQFNDVNALDSIRIFSNVLALGAEFLPVLEYAHVCGHGNPNTEVLDMSTTGGQGLGANESGVLKLQIFLRIISQQRFQ